jgi:hypothetical protein
MLVECGEGTSAVGLSIILHFGMPIIYLSPATAGVLVLCSSVLLMAAVAVLECVVRSLDMPTLVFLWQRRITMRYQTLRIRKHQLSRASDVASTRPCRMILARVKRYAPCVLSFILVMQH